MSSQLLPQPFAAVIARLHAAMAKVADGDISAIKALYAHSDDATSFYGWGGYEKGWDAVSKRWDWAGGQFKGGTVSYQNVTTVATAELAYTTDIETFQVRMDGMDRPTQWSNRVTHIFRLDDGEWRLVHRHANRL
jgi:ketosteroid isomerase-like protein